jgi:hypothetical protein
MDKGRAGMDGGRAANTEVAEAMVAVRVVEGAMPPIADKMKANTPGFQRSLGF